MSKEQNLELLKEAFEDTKNPMITKDQYIWFLEGEKAMLERLIGINNTVIQDAKINYKLVEDIARAREVRGRTYQRLLSIVDNKLIRHLKN